MWVGDLVVCDFGGGLSSSGESLKEKGHSKLKEGGAMPCRGFV